MVVEVKKMICMLESDVPGFMEDMDEEAEDEDDISIALVY